MIAVWDTYVKRPDGRTMHFDILVPAMEQSEDRVFAYGNDYLQKKGIAGQLLSSSECSFCHVESGTEEQIAAIDRNGYAVIEMDHCD